MKHKLKKKTIIHDIVFPQTFNQKIKQNQTIQLDNNKSSTNNHRRLSKSYEKCQSLKHQNRSISGLKKYWFNPNFEKKITHEKKESKVQVKLQKSKSLIKNRKAPSSSSQISSMFFKGMEANLVKECDKILKMEKPRRSQSTCQLQSLTKNMFLLHRPNPKEEGTKFKSKETLNQLTVPNEYQEGNQPISLVRVDSMTNSQEQEDIGFLQKDMIVQSDVDFDSDEITSMHYLEDRHKKKNSDVLQKRPLIESQRSIMSSQTRYQKMTSSLVNSKVYLISSRLLPKNVGIFSVDKIQLTNKFNPEISIFFQISNEIVFKSIQSGNQKRPNDLKLRRHHTRRLQHIREKSRQKIFSNFKKGLVTSHHILYEDILSYIEQCTILDHSYKGLALRDQDEVNVMATDQQKIMEILSISTYFYFFLRLGSTFYLVKASKNQIKGIYFTFLCDFTTLSTGDQLTFQHNQIEVKKNRNKPIQTLIYAVQEFKANAEEQWCKDLEVDGEVTAKIGKISTQTLQKCDQGDLGLWGVNKKFEMVGDVTNFFQFHDHFDYGFFNKPLNYFKSGPLFYQFSRTKPILFYQYPQTYQYIEASQMQREALVIAHLQPFSEQYQDKSIRSFYERNRRKAKIKTSTQFVMNIKKQRITVTLGDTITIFVQSSVNLRGHKLTVSRTNFLKGVKQISVSELSSRVEDTLKKYKLEHSFLYKRYQLLKEPEIYIYYKSIHKLEGQFVFVILYKLIKMGLIEFKIYTFKLGRLFIIRLEVQDLTTQEVKETVTNLIGIFKGVYFKRVLQMQARRSEKRRKEALQEFFKHQIKFNPTNIRGKRKNEEELRKKNLMRLTSIKNASLYNPIQQVIITKLCTTYNKRHCYFTIRYLPNKELKQTKGDMQEQLQICLYSSQKITYFRYVSTLKQLSDLITEELRNHQHLDSKQLFNIYKGITEKIVKIIRTTSGNFKFLIARLRNLFNPTHTQKQFAFHPLLFRLIGNNLFQTKETVNFGKKFSTKLSIDFEISNPVSLASFNLLDSGQSFPSQFKLAIPSIGKISGDIDRLVNLTFLVDIAPQWHIEIIEIYSRGQEFRIGEGFTIKDRYVRLVDRQTQKCLIVGQWEGDFVSTIKYTQYNKRMFKRLFRAVRKSL